MDIKEARNIISRAIFQTSPFKYEDLADVEKITGVKLSKEKGDRAILQKALNYAKVDRYIEDIENILLFISPRRASINVDPDKASISTVGKMMLFQITRDEKNVSSGTKYTLVSNDLGTGPLEIIVTVKDGGALHFESGHKRDIILGFLEPAA